MSVPPPELPPVHTEGRDAVFYSEPMDCVFEDWLHITGEFFAFDLNEVKASGLECIISMQCDETPNYITTAYELMGIKFGYYPIPDSPTEDIIELSKALYFVLRKAKHHRPTPLKTVVHCKMGVSRSVAAVCYFIMHMLIMPFDEVMLRFILPNHPRGMPNWGFRSQLQREYPTDFTKKRLDEFEAEMKEPSELILKYLAHAREQNNIRSIGCLTAAAKKALEMVKSSEC